VAVKELSGKRCLITGAASGIGRATAKAAAVPAQVPLPYELAMRALNDRLIAAARRD